VVIKKEKKKKESEADDDTVVLKKDKKTKVESSKTSVEAAQKSRPKMKNGGGETAATKNGDGGLDKNKVNGHVQSGNGPSPDFEDGAENNFESKNHSESPVRPRNESLSEDHPQIDKKEEIEEDKQLPEQLQPEKPQQPGKPEQPQPPRPRGRLLSDKTGSKKVRNGKETSRSISPSKDKKKSQSLGDEFDLLDGPSTKTKKKEKEKKKDKEKEKEKPNEDHALNEQVSML